MIGAARSFVEVDLSGMVSEMEELDYAEDVEAEGSEITKKDDTLTSVHSV